MTLFNTIERLALEAENLNGADFDAIIRRMGYTAEFSQQARLINQGRAQARTAPAAEQAPPAPANNSQVEALSQQGARNANSTAADDIPQRLLELRDLRIGNEPDHKLVRIPATQAQGLDAIPMRTDPRSQHLRGRAYLEFLANDGRIGPGLQVVLEGSRILSANPPLSDERLENIAERLRPVAAAIYHDNARQDYTLTREVDRLADQVSIHCDDRVEFTIGQIEDAALLARLSRGDIDEVTLYNRGIAFFMLDQVIQEVGRETTAHRAQTHEQSVMALLEAIYFLQDTLHLPHQQERPIWYGMGVSFMTEAIATRIGERVRQAATENDGERVFQFMSTWAPWVDYLKGHAELHEDFAILNEYFQRRMTKLMTDRDNPQSRYHSSKMDPVTFDFEVAEVGALRNAWLSDYVVQQTRAFMVNHRADYLLEAGVVPECFGGAPADAANPRAGV